MMYGCPNCGRIITFKEDASAQCPACGSETLPKDSARCKVNADSSYFSGIINFADAVKQLPALSFLSNRVFDISLLSSYSVAHGKYWLNSYTTLSDDVVDYSAQTIVKRLSTQREMTNAILSIPNNYWYVTTKPGESRASVFFAHPNGSYTALSLIKSSSYREEWFSVDVRRFDNAPSSLNELEAIFHAFPSFNDRLVSSASTTNIPEYKPEPIHHLRKPEYGLILQNLDLQQIEINKLLADKHQSIVIERSGDPVLLQSPKINAERLKAINQQFYIDDKLGQGVAIACASCGSPITGYANQVSFLRCERCLHITDLVGSERLSPDLLNARKPSETFIPADYFLQLLNSVERSGGPKAERILYLLSIKDNYLKESEALEFIDAISWIAFKHPYLMSFYRFKTKYEDYPSHTGGVLNIIFPNTSTINNGSLMGGGQYLNFAVPTDLQGKVLSIYFGDFDNGGPKEPNEYWCRVRSKLFDAYDFDSRFENNVNSWGHQVVYNDERESEDHWCERFDKVACSGFNKPIEGPIYERIAQAMQTMPPNNFFLNSNR